MTKTSLRRYKVETWDIMQFLFARFNDHQVRSVIRFDTHINEERLKQAVDRLAIFFPLIRCRFCESTHHPYWEEIGFTADDIVFLKETENADEEIQKAICLKINTFEGPQFRILVVRNDKADVLCVIINHMLCDGEGFKEVLYLLSSIYSHLENNPAYSLGSRSVQQVIRTFGWRDKTKIIFQRYGLSRHNNSIKFEIEGDRNAPFIVTRTIPRDRFHTIKAYAKQYGTTVNDVLLAAYIRSLHKTLDGQTAAIQCVVDIRKYLPAKKAEGFCNLTSNLVCDIGPVIGEEFHDTLMKVKKTMDTEKQALSCLNLIIRLEVLFRTMPYKTAKRLVLKYYHNPPLAMSNLGIIDQKRLSFEGVHITEAFMTGSIKYSPFFQLALSTFNDQITFSVGFHGTLADKGKIQEFLTELDNELQCS
jgi:NRPS condensation-like uncharacterized protein